MTQSRARAGRIRRRTAGGVIVTTVAFACLASTLAACGGTTTSNGTVSLLPSAGAKGQSWSWTASCPYGPHGESGCDAAGPDLGSSQLAGNEWNLGGTQSKTESVTMSVGSSGSLALN